MHDHSTGKATVLVVAENGALIGDLKSALTLGKYELHVAKQTRHAVEILNAVDAQTDVTIVDLEFPGGFALIGHLIHRVPKKTKVIASSTFFDGSFLSRLKKLGVDDTMQSPASPQAWRRIIASVLAPGDSTASSK